MIRRKKSRILPMRGRGGARGRQSLMASRASKLGKGGTFKNQIGEGTWLWDQWQQDIATYGLAKCAEVAPWMDCKCDCDLDGITDVTVPLSQTENQGIMVPNYPMPINMTQGMVLSSICCQNACERPCDDGTGGGDGGDWGPPVNPSGHDGDTIIDDDEQVNPIDEGLTGSDGFTPVWGGTNPRPRPVIGRPVFGDTVPRPRPTRPTTVPRPRPPRRPTRKNSSSQGRGGIIQKWFGLLFNRNA